MRSLFFVLSVLAVIGSGFWAYTEINLTQDELDEVDLLQEDIALARERLSILKAEWAYLNRPDRLRDLADLNFDRLGLLPLRPDQFGQIDQVAYPAPPALELTQPVEVSSVGATNP